jgi:aminomethyltransferase
MSELCAPAADLQFLTGCRAEIDGAEAYITCSGYTGEDGFEISLPANASENVARRLLAMDAVQPIGLGARDSLRLEAGLCLYGHELTTDIDLVQAGLVWTIGKARRPDGERPGGFPGAETIFAGMENKPPLARVGLRVESKRPVREGQVVLDESGREVGEICSAAYGASVGGPIAMAYIARELSVPGTSLSVTVRDKQIPVSVSALPFNPHRYHRG